MACILLAAAACRPAYAQQRLDVPIILPGPRYALSDCTGGEVYNLDPRGDNFLSVLSGPGSPRQGYREIDRIIGNGQEVFVCGYRGAWVAIIYQNGRGIFSSDFSSDCDVAPSRRPYTGPCSHGWVHRNYVRVTAG